MEKITHPRSETARTRRNKRKNGIKKEKKKQAHANQKQSHITTEARNMELQKQNRILKKAVKPSKLALATQRRVFNGPINYSVKLLKSFNDKAFSITKELKEHVPVFQSIDVDIDSKELGSGVYGIVYTGFIKSLQQKVAVKNYTNKSSHTSILAEAMVCRRMSGHPSFVHLFGTISSPDRLLFEYVGDQLTAPSLSTVLTKQLIFQHWLTVCVDLVRALDALHDRGLLHNDLHSGNILLRNIRYVKIIDFGKCTLISDPVMYSIQPGTEKHQRYNTRHKHLAVELRNKPGSYVSCESDVYTLGYNFDQIGTYVENTGLRFIASFMMMPQPESRFKLSEVLLKLSKI
eukprot:TCONS_00034776-protein